jgi:hypothetical protein
MKDTPVFAAGSPYTFANAGLNKCEQKVKRARLLFATPSSIYGRRWILIPPQVQWYVDYRIFNVVTGATIAATEGTAIGCYLFGTRVLLNFNTSI